MPGVNPSVLADLAAPTPTDQVKQRQGPGGRMLSYVDARYVYDILDRVVGPENWQDRFEDSRFPGAIRGGICIRIDDGDGSGNWVCKWDIGVASDIEPEKGAHSEAIKRAAVHWGIARDLYGADPVSTGQPSQRAPLVQRQGAPVAQVQTAGQPVASPWACPVHGQFKVVPGGHSQRTGKDYAAFFACPINDCQQKPPRGTVVPPQMVAQATPPQYEQPPLPVPPSEYTDAQGDMPY